MEANKIITGNSSELFSTNKFIQDFCLLAEYVGLSKEEFSKAINLPVNRIDEVEGVVSQQYIVKAYEVLLSYTNDELLGSENRKLPRGAFDLMIKSACTEKNLFSALNAIYQVNRIIQNPLRTKFIIKNNIVQWQFKFSTNYDQLSLLMATLFTCISYKTLSMLLKKEVPLLSVSFIDDTPINVSDYQFLYSCPVKFGQNVNEIIFDKKWLEKPIHCNYDDVKKHLDIPLSVTNYSFHELGLIQKVKAILVISPINDFPSQKELAIKLGMSVRTMQRKLDSENSSYMIIKDDFRHKKALFYLEHTQKSIDAITEKCGFSDITSFKRAFTRWQGESPAKFQKH